MEALDILKSMEKISPDLINDPATQSQMKNFVNMLDDMAANSPEDYWKFIRKNLETGAEEMKKESGKEKVTGKFEFCIKTYTKDKKEIVIINVCSSELVLRPLRSDRSIADVLDLNTWSTIPVSFSNKNEKKEQGKKIMWYFDALVHSCVAEWALKDLRCKSHIVSVICKRLEGKINSTLLFDQGIFDYFERYKGLSGQSAPESQYLELAADPEEYSKYFKRIFYIELKEKQKFDTYEEAKKAPQIITTPVALLEKPTLPAAKVEEISLTSTPNKSLLIEEIKNYQIDVHEFLNKGNVVVNEHKADIEIEVHLPQESGMKGIILDAGKTSIKLQSPSFSFSVTFLSYSLLDSQISAKWLKNKKKLVIKCPKTH